MLKKNFEKFFFLDFFLNFFPIFSSDKSPASGKENVRFLVSPDFETLPDFRTGQWCPVEPYYVELPEWIVLNYGQHVCDDDVCAFDVCVCHGVCAFCEPPCLIRIP